MTPAAQRLQPRVENLRDHLRRATHEWHVRLNHHPLLAGLSRPDYPRSSYVSVLIAYHEFYRVVEAAIETAIARLSPGFDYASRRKLGWLEADLAALGVCPDTLPPWPGQLPRVPGIETLGDLVGALYVIEGSTLGGQVISRHLLRQHGMGRENGARFFHAYGPDVEARWLDYLAWAESLASREIQTDAGNHAVAWFRFMEALLDARGHTEH